MNIERFAEKRKEKARTKEARSQNHQKTHALTKNVWESAKELGLTIDEHLHSRTHFFKLENDAEIMIRRYGVEWEEGSFAVVVRVSEEQDEQYAWISSKGLEEKSGNITYADHAEIAKADRSAADIELIGILEQVQDRITEQTRQPVATY